jgi:hypothetical protein
MTLQVHLELTGVLEKWAREQADPVQAIVQALGTHVLTELTPFETAAAILTDGFRIQHSAGYRTRHLAGS